MFRRKLIIAAIVALLTFFCAAEAEQISVSWDGGGDGRSWADPCNWEPNIVPDNNETYTFAVTIDGGAGALELQLHNSRTIDRLDCYGDFRWYIGVYQSIQGASMAIDLTLNEPNGLSNYGDLVLFIYGAQFSRIVGNITNHGVLELQSDIGYIKGNVTNVSGAELYLNNMSIMTGSLYNLAGAVLESERVVDVVGGDVENAGSIIVLSASELMTDSTFYNTGQIQLYGGSCESEGLFHNDVNGVIKGFGAILTEELLHNEGQINAYGGSLAIASDGALVNEAVLRNHALSSLHITPSADVNNHDTIEIKSGGGVAFDCNLVNEAGGAITVEGGTLAAGTIMQIAGATLEGFGTIASDLLIAPGGSVSIAGPTNIVGDVVVATGATLAISDGTTLITGHCRCNNGTISISRATPIAQGGFTNNGCSIIHKVGTDKKRSDFNLDGRANLGDLAYLAYIWLSQAEL